MRFVFILESTFLCFAARQGTRASHAVCSGKKYHGFSMAFLCPLYSLDEKSREKVSAKWKIVLGWPGNGCMALLQYALRTLLHSAERRGIQEIPDQLL